MVSVNSVFSMLDRASPALRHIRQEAERTDAALAHAGKSADNFADTRRTKRIDAAAAGFADVARHSNEASIALGRVERSGGRVHRVVNALRGTVGGLATPFKLLKLPAMVVGFVALGQAITGVAGAAVGLLAHMKSLAALGAPLASVYGAVGLAAGTAKLAFGGLGDALSGNEKALKKLTPEARKFVGYLKTWQDEVKKLRLGAQASMFPGLTRAMEAMRKDVPMVERLTKRMGRAMGETAELVARGLSTKGSRRNMEAVGEQSVTTFRRMGQGALHLSRALLDVLVVARPFTDWITRSAAAWTKHAEATTHAARVNGKLAGFFRDARSDIQKFLDVGRNVAHVLGNIAHAASPLGGRMLDSIVLLTDRWSRWTDSVRGKTAMRTFFDGLEPVVRATAGLVGDLATALAHLATDPNTAGMIEKLRDAVGPLEHVIRSVTKALGPQLADGVVQVARLADNLSGVVGPLGLFVTGVGHLAGYMSDLAESSPAVKSAMTAIFSMALIGRFLRKVRETRAEVEAMSRFQGAMLGGPGVNAVGVPLGKPRGGGTVGPTMGMPLPVPMPGGRGPAGMLGRGWARLTGRGAQMAAPVEAARPAFGFSRVLAGQAPAAEAAVARGGMRGLLGRGGGRLLAGAGARGAARVGLGALRFIGGPATLALSGVLGAAMGQGNVGQRAMQGVNFAGFGLPGLAANALGFHGFNAPKAPPDPDESAAEVIAKGPGATLRRSAELRRQLAAGSVQREGRGRPMVAGRAGIVARPGAPAGSATGTFSFQHTLGGDARKRAEREYKQVRAQEVAIRQTQGEQAGGDIIDAFGVRAQAKGMGAARKGVLGDLRDTMRKEGPVAKTEMARQVAGLIAQLNQGDKSSRRTARLMTKTIESSFAKAGRTIKIANGEIYTGTASEWERIRSTMSTKAEKARQEVSSSFTALQAQAYAALQAMGFSKGEARSLISAKEQGGQKGKIADVAAASAAAGNTAVAKGQAGALNIPTAKRARGGRLPGQTLSDSLMMADGGLGAPGELVVNRHTERDHDRDARAAGLPSLAQRVAGQRRPHSAPVAARALGAMGGIMPGLATGGRAPTGMRRGGDAGTVTPAAAGGAGSQTGSLAAMISAANRIDAQHYPYRWGGGHDANFTPPYDCSGAVSMVLHSGGVLNSPVTSGSLAGMFAPGPGEVSIYANPKHTYMSLAGQFFGTSTSNPGGGAGWFAGGARPGFTVRHVPVDGTGGAAAMFANVAGGGGPAPQIAALKGGKSGLGGVPGALSTQAQALMAAGLTQKINTTLAATGGPGLGAGDGTVSAGGAYNKGALASLWTAQGGPAGVADLMAAIALAESNGNPRAHNPSGASGLWQILGLPFAGDPFDPATNARMAVSKYRSQGLGAWEAYTNGMYRRFMATGGRIGMAAPNFAGWFADGGRVLADSPTLLGIGEGHGKEEAVIRKVGGAGGARIGKLADRIVINNHRAGDIKAQLKKEVEDAFAELATTLDHLPLEDEEGAL